MPKNLLIVESPTKAKKISAFLKSGEWEVVASVGHIRDLEEDIPEKVDTSTLITVGVERNGFRPRYAISADKKDVISNVKRAARGAHVFLATDPDREGEAIAWHLAQVLELSNPDRVTFNEITEGAVLQGINNPRKIDVRLVAAQEARRVLDRLIGYIVSPSLLAGQEKGLRLSAGRVQSVALRLIVDRERAIRLFKSVEHYGAQAKFSGDWTADWDSRPHMKPEDTYFMDRAFATRVAALRHFEVVRLEDKEVKQAPPPAFTTSTLQQAASNALGMSPGDTMKVAQALFEQGHITYMRTDNPNLSAEAIEDIRAWARQHHYAVPDKPRKWRVKASAQGAHEAIRATHLEIDSAGSKPEEQALYQLIRRRAIASQLADAVFDARIVRLKATDKLDGQEIFFDGRGRALKFEGWKRLLKKDDASVAGADPEMSNPIPLLTVGSLLEALKGELLIKRTEPPQRFTEATLVKEMESRGIGRPSTYAAILANLANRKYFQLDAKRRILPTETGERLRDLLMDKKYSFMEYDYTLEVETRLDMIAEGVDTYFGVVSDSYDTLIKEMGREPAPPRRPGARGTTGGAHRCACGKDLIQRQTEKGKFWGCSSFPDCTRRYRDDNGKPARD